MVKHGGSVVLGVLPRAFQRHRAVGRGRLHGLKHLVDGGTQALSHLGHRGRALQLAREVVGRLVDLGGKLLQTAGHAHAPALVPEVALDLAHDGGRGKSRELKATIGVKAVDGLDQAYGCHLHEVVKRLAAVLELARQEADQVEMAHNQLLASLFVALFLVQAKELAGALLVPCDLALARRTLGPLAATLLGVATRHGLPPLA